MTPTPTENDSSPRSSSGTSYADDPRPDEGTSQLENLGPVAVAETKRSELLSPSQSGQWAPGETGVGDMGGLEGSDARYNVKTGPGGLKVKVETIQDDDSDEDDDEMEETLDIDNTPLLTCVFLGENECRVKMSGGKVCDNNREN